MALLWQGGPAAPSTRVSILRSLACVSVLAGLVHLLTIDLVVNPYDESLILYGAARVMRGELPYRDFWTLYGPGSFYVVGALFRLFGESVAASRAFDTSVRIAIVALCFLLVSRARRPWLAWTVATVVLVLLVSVQHYAFPVFPALMAALLSLYLLDFALRSRQPRMVAVFAGACVGVVALFRHDLGIYTVIACGVFLAQRWHEGRHGRAARVRGVQWLALAGFVAVVLPVVVALGALTPMSDLYDDFVRIPFSVYPRFRSLPWPSPWPTLTPAASPGAFAFIVYAPALIVCACFALAWRNPKRDEAVAPQSYRPLLLALIVLAALFALKGMVRVSPLHMAPALVVSAVVLALSAATQPSGSNGLRLLGVTAVVCAFPLLGSTIQIAREVSGAAAMMLRGSAPGAWHRVVQACAHPAMPRLRCGTTTDERIVTAQFLADHTPPGRAVYVGAGRHDKLFLNDVLVYFLSGTSAPTKWYDLHPGVQTTVEVQKAMIEDFRLKPPAWVVLDTQWDDEQEPNRSRVSSGVTLLDDYLRSKFVARQRFGTLTIFGPREGALP